MIVTSHSLYHKPRFSFIHQDGWPAENLSKPLEPTSDVSLNISSDNFIHCLTWQQIDATVFFLNRPAFAMWDKYIDSSSLIFFQAL